MKQIIWFYELSSIEDRWYPVIWRLMKLGDNPDPDRPHFPVLQFMGKVLDKYPYPEHLVSGQDLEIHDKHLYDTPRAIKDRLITLMFTKKGSWIV